MRHSLLQTFCHSKGHSNCIFILLANKALIKQQVWYLLNIDYKKMYAYLLTDMCSNISSIVTMQNSGWFQISQNMCFKVVSLEICKYVWGVLFYNKNAVFDDDTM